MEVTREQCCCFTGHRFLSREERARLRISLRETLLDLLEQGVKVFFVGGALGFDTLAEQEILRLKNETGREMYLVMVLPCQDSDKNWRERDTAVFRTLRRSADAVVYTGQEYTTGCMFVRNRYMVDHSSICVAYLRENTVRGGTLYTVNYAARRGLQQIVLK